MTLRPLLVALLLCPALATAQSTQADLDNCAAGLGAYKAAWDSYIACRDGPNALPGESIDEKVARCGAEVALVTYALHSGQEACAPLSDEEFQVLVKAFEEAN